MKTKNSSPARNVVLAALFLALAFVLPMVTGHLPQVGNMLCPMHFPILLCGFVLGGPWGLAVGFAAPLLRSVLFGMPPMFPIAISMAFELAVYGAVSGWHGGWPPRLGRGPFRAGGSVRLELPLLGLPVRRALHRCAGHHRTAGAHPPHHHRSAESKAHGLSLYRKMAEASRPQPFCFAYYLRRKSGRGLPCLSH